MSDTLAAAIQAALLRIEEGQQQMRADIAVLRTAVDDRLQAVEKTVTDSLQIIERTVTDLRVALMDRMDRQQDALTALGDAQQQAEQTVTDLRVALMDRMDRQQDALTALGDAQRQAEQAVTDLRVALMDRMDRLQDTLTGIRDDVGVNMHHSDRVRQAHDNTREELRSMGDSVAQLLIRLRKVEDAVRVLRGDP